jgi:hypothetical protein
MEALAIANASFLSKVSGSLSHKNTVSIKTLGAVKKIEIVFYNPFFYLKL